MSGEQEKITLAKCGMDCTACRFAEENDCPGCMYCQPAENRTKLFEDEECEIGICCEKKGCEHCGRCPDFPCEALKEVSFDTETGDGGARLMRLKEIHDKEYRRKNRMISRPLAGLCVGIAIGTVIGAVSGSIAPWIFACAVSGMGLGTITAIAGKDK